MPKEITTQLLDAEGHHLIHPRPHDNLKQARAWCREHAKDRAYWERHAESKTFPDEVASLAILRGGEILEEYRPAWLRQA
jgi:hypothetical protein